MVHAICLKCGNGKAGALARCPKCTFLPEKTEDKAKSVILSDRCAKMPALERVAERIARGEKVKFDESDVHKWADALEAMPKPTVKVLGLSKRHWTVLAVAIGAGVAFGFCLAGTMLLLN
jgi:hypothetical protein